MSLLRLGPDQWKDYLEQMNYRFPQNGEEYNKMRAFLEKDAGLTKRIPALNMRKAGQTQSFLVSGAKEASQRECFPTIGEGLCGGAARCSPNVLKAHRVAI